MLLADDGLGSTELGGLDFGGDVTLNSGPELPTDPGRKLCLGQIGLKYFLCQKVKSYSLFITSFSQDLALCSARGKSNCFFWPGTALHWLCECVLQVRDLV